MCDKDKETIIAEKIYETIVTKGMEYYKEIYERSDVKTGFYGRAIDLFRKFNDKEKEVFYSVLETVMIDASATLLAILDGAACWRENDDYGVFETKVIIDDLDMEHDMHDFFLQVAEEKDPSRVTGE